MHKIKFPLTIKTSENRGCIVFTVNSEHIQRNNLVSY